MQKKNIIMSIIAAILLILIVVVILNGGKKEIKVASIQFETGEVKEIIGTMTYDISKNSLNDLPVVTKEGHTFIGWFLDASRSQKFKGKLTSESMKLYADFTINTYIVTIITTKTEQIEVIYNQKIKSLETPQKEGYTFIGWFLDNKYEKEFEPQTLIKENIVLFAKFEIE